ncbi:MAG TPA: hypothetical protein VHR66_27300 [Gemmataceae bacterium]|jgi:hypothetical protein|nr:hypothetical protein [Gemmataceae bacterium]
MSVDAMNDRLIDAYRRERLSFTQYILQATPYAGPADRSMLERVQAIAGAEAKSLDGFADYLADNRVIVPFLGAFPSVFTNYNFIAVRRLLPQLATDQARGLAALERDALASPPGDARTWLERLANDKRMHMAELTKLMDRTSGSP